MCCVSHCWKWQHALPASQWSEATMCISIFGRLAEDGETLNCMRETTNRRDPFSVAVIVVVVENLASFSQAKRNDYLLCK